MKKGKTIDEATYNVVRKLREDRVTAKEIARVIPISISTIGRIKASENYEEYKTAASVAAYSVKSMKAKEEKKQEEQKPQTVAAAEPILPTIRVVAEGFMMEEMKKQTELLKGISEKLAFIVEQLV